MNHFFFFAYYNNFCYCNNKKKILIRLTEPTRTCITISPMPALVTRTDVAHPAKTKKVKQKYAYLFSLCHKTLHDTLIIKDVFSIGKHAGEYAAEEKPTQAGPDKQKDATGVENKQHQHSNNCACL